MPATGARGRPPRWPPAETPLPPPSDQVRHADEQTTTYRVLKRNSRSSTRGSFSAPAGQGETNTNACTPREDRSPPPSPGRAAEPAALPGPGGPGRPASASSAGRSAVTRPAPRRSGTRTPGLPAGRIRPWPACRVRTRPSERRSPARAQHATPAGIHGPPRAPSARSRPCYHRRPPPSQSREA